MDNDSENKFLKCREVARRGGHEQAQKYYASLQNRQEQIKEDGMRDDMESRAYKTRQGQAREIHSLGVILGHEEPHHN